MHGHCLTDQESNLYLSGGKKTTKKTLTFWKDTCTPMFISALFAIAKLWKQTSADVYVHQQMRIKKMWCICVCVYIYIYIYTHTGIPLRHKKEWNFSICGNMNGLREYYARWNKSDKERQTLCDITHMQNLKK